MQLGDYHWSLLTYVITALLTLYVVTKFLAYLKKRSILNNLPGPNLHPVWGTVHLGNMEDYIKEHENEKIIRCRQGPFLYFVRLVDPELVGKVLSMGALQAPKAEITSSIISDFLGLGLLLLNHDKWFTHRRLLTPAFHGEVIKSYVETHNDCVDVLLQKWMDGMQDGNDVVEVYQNLNLLSLDVILRCVCSYESECQIENCNNAAKEYISAVLESSELALKRFFHLPYYIPFYFNLTPTGAKWREVCSKIKAESLKIVKKRREDILSGKKSVKNKLDFIDILLTTADASGSPLSDTEIMSEMNTFIFVGHDTVASGTSWTLYTLGNHPEIQKQCRDEIRSVLGERDSIEWDDLTSLKFTTKCIKEAMRLYPPVPVISRTLTQDLSVDQYVIPKGTTVMLSILLMHRHPKHWKNPDSFDPTRFDNEKPGGSNFSYIPFSAGHRNCIGHRFAQMEQLITVARILNKFELESISRGVKHISHLTLKPDGPLFVKLTLA